MDIEQAKQNQLKNIETRTGKSLAELVGLVKESGLTKHTEVIAMLKEKLAMGHGDANAIALYAKNAYLEVTQKAGDVLDDIYTGAKAALRPIHDKLMAEISKWGDHEVAPKKGYVSLRRKKQFAMVGPANNTKVEIGLNLKGVTGTERLVEQAPGGMCQYKVRVGSIDEIDDEVIKWIQAAYDSAG